MRTFWLSLLSVYFFFSGHHGCWCKCLASSPQPISPLPVLPTLWIWSDSDAAAHALCLMGNSPSGTQIEAGLQSGDFQQVQASLKQLCKSMDGRGKGSISWPGMLHALSVLLSTHSANTKAVVSSPELYKCLSCLTHLPRAVVIDDLFQAVLQRNLLVSVLMALSKDYGPQAKAVLVASLEAMLGDQPEAALEDMAHEDCGGATPPRGFTATLAKKLGHKLQEKKYSAQRCGLFLKHWKKLLQKVTQMEKHSHGLQGPPVNNNDVTSHPLVPLLQQVKEFEGNSIPFAVFLFHHYLTTCLAASIPTTINLLMELRDFLQSCIARITTALLVMQSDQDEVVWSAGARIVLRPPLWLNELGDLLYNLITSNRQHREDDRRIIASVAYSCFQVYAQAYPHSSKVLDLVKDAATPFANISRMTDLAGSAQELELSLCCLHAHVLHVRVSDTNFAQCLDVLCLVLYRFAPYLLDTRSAPGLLLASAARCCIHCLQGLITHPLLATDACCRELVLRIIALCHARFREEMEGDLFECICSIMGLWSTEHATCIMTYILEASLQLITPAALFWYRLQQDSDPRETQASLQAFAADLCVVPRDACPISTRLLDTSAILAASPGPLQGCLALLRLLDTCQAPNRSVDPTDDSYRRPPQGHHGLPLQPLGFEGPPEGSSVGDLLLRLDFLCFVWGGDPGFQCSVLDLYSVNAASRCRVELPSALLWNAERYVGLLDALSDSLHDIVQVIIGKMHRLLCMVHATTPVAADAMAQFVRFFGTMHASHLVCYMEAAILAAAACPVLPPVRGSAAGSALEPPRAEVPAPAVSSSSAGPSSASVMQQQQQQLVQQLKEEVQQLGAENQRLQGHSEAASRLEAIMETVTCSVCFEPFMQREPCALHCGHIFCYACIEPLLATQCPMCRTPIDGQPPVKLKSFGLES